MAMIHPRSSRRCSGYTLTVVLISLMLLVGLWCFVVHTTSSLLRVETVRSMRATRDQGAMNAMAWALELLQYGTPSDPNNPDSVTFTYYVTLNVPGTSPITGTNTTPAYYMVVYTCLSPGSDTNPPQWQVQVSPVSATSVDPTKTLPNSVTPPIAWPAGAGQS
jgi:hypothetical protein